MNPILNSLMSLRNDLRDLIIAGPEGFGNVGQILTYLYDLSVVERSIPDYEDLSSQVRRIVSSEEPERTRVLLNALRTVDRIRFQMAANRDDGPVAPLRVERVETGEEELPWSRISGLLHALHGNGPNQCRLAKMCREQQPELFRDWRVKNALVKALGSREPELVETARDWLMEMGPEAVSLLKNGFDPRGGLEMIRRVQLLEDIAGGEENAFYLECLSEAKGKVRIALLYALRLHPGNSHPLLEFYRTERGGCRYAVRMSLARMRTPEASDFWEKKKQRGLALRFAWGITCASLCRAVARALSDWMEPYETDPDAELNDGRILELYSLLDLVPGKYGPELVEIFHRMVALGPVLDRKMWVDETEQLRLFRIPLHRDGTEEVPFSEMTGALLAQVVLSNPTEEMLQLAEQMGKTANGRFTAAGIVAILLGHKAREAYGMAGSYLKRAACCARTPQSQVLVWALEDLEWDEKRQIHVFRYEEMDPVEEATVEKSRPLPEPLDRRWVRVLMRLDREGEMHPILFHIVPRTDRELCASVAEWLYQQGLRGIGLEAEMLDVLREMGWNRCRGLGTRYAQCGVINLWKLQNFLSRLPGEESERRGEYEGVLELARQRKVLLEPHTSPDAFISVLESRIRLLFDQKAAKG